MTPAKIYPFSIPAGGSFPLLVIGDYCKILTSSGPLTLTGDTFGTIGPILAGQGIENSPFQRLVLTDNTGAVNNGTILIADNKFIDDRITGEVSVIDGGKSRTMANNSFIGWLNCAALAANYSSVQLWNPVASGKRLIVEQLSISSVTGSIFYAGFKNVELPTIAAYSAKTKLFGSAINSAALFKTQQTAGIALTEIAKISGPVNTQIIYLPRSPFIINPGFGLVVFNGVVNSDISTIPEWFEETL